MCTHVVMFTQVSKYLINQNNTNIVLPARTFISNIDKSKECPLISANIYFYHEFSADTAFIK